MAVKKKKVAKEEQTYVIQLSMPAATLRRLNVIAKTIQCTRMDVIKRALGLMEYCVAARKNGYRVVIIDANRQAKAEIADIIPEKRQKSKLGSKKQKGTGGKKAKETA